VGILEKIAGRRTYLDVNLFIYALESHPDYLAVVTELFEAIDRGTVSAVTSELSLAEALVKPCLDKRDDLQTIYKSAIAPSSGLDVPPISREILIDSAEIRAQVKLRLPDAMHMATARRTGCQVFLTNDLALRPIEGIEIIHLADFGRKS
jgi:predicted nucleic acid-binding protein